MSDSSKTAILFNTDPLISKGLALLLTDLQINVISAESSKELNEKLAATSAVPDLFIFPLLLDTQQPSISFIRNCRQRFGHDIPAIILNDDTPLHELLLSDKHLMVLPDQIKPAILREKVLQSLSA